MKTLDDVSHRRAIVCLLEVHRRNFLSCVMLFHSQGVEDIQRDMMRYGSVTASFSVYSDFLAYSGGVYENLEGEAMVEIVGLPYPVFMEAKYISRTDRHSFRTNPLIPTWTDT